MMLLTHNRYPVPVTLVFFCMIFYTGCEDPEEDRYFLKTFGFNKNDVAYSFALDKNGEAILCGYTTSIMTSEEILAMKVSTDGHVLWTKSFGGHLFDRGLKIIRTSDGYFTLGGIITVKGFMDLALIKINSQGQVVWSKNLGLKGENILHAMHPDPYGGCFMLCYSNRDMRLFRYDFLGDTLWTRTIGKLAGEDIGRAVIKQNNQNIYICGNTNSFTNGQIPFIIELDNNGREQWTSIITDFPVQSEIHDMAVTKSDGIYLAGRFERSPGHYAILFMKTDNQGNFLWRKRLAGEYFQSGIYDIEQSAEGDFILTGYVTLENLVNQAYVARVSTDGEILWAKTFGDEGSATGHQSIILQNDDILTIGNFKKLNIWYNDILFIKMNSHGIIP